MRRDAALMHMKFEETGLSKTYPGKIFRKDENKGEAVRLHYHSSLEINSLHGVSGTVRIGEYSFDLRNKASIVIPPGVLHSYHIDPSPGGSVDVYQISLPHMKHILNDSVLSAFFPRISCSSQALTEIERLFPEDGHKIDLLRTGRLLFTLLDSLEKEGSSEQIPKDNVYEKVYGNQVLKRVIDHVENHYAEKISLEETASLAGYSRSAFASMFLARTGSTFHRFLQQVRLDYSCIHLCAGESVTAAAHLCGFSDASHYIRVFKAQYGKTPLQYQKQMTT